MFWINVVFSRFPTKTEAEEKLLCYDKKLIYLWNKIKSKEILVFKIPEPSEIFLSEVPLELEQKIWTPKIYGETSIPSIGETSSTRGIQFCFQGTRKKKYKIYLDDDLYEKAEGIDTIPFEDETEKNAKNKSDGDVTDQQFRLAVVGMFRQSKFDQKEVFNKKFWTNRWKKIFSSDIDFNKTFLED